ncbi:MAG: hypothetical protein P8Y30_07910 [candidate division WOR-3 bacterium]
MNRKSFIITLFGIFFILKKRLFLLFKEENDIPESSLKTDRKLLG